MEHILSRTTKQTRTNFEERLKPFSAKSPVSNASFPSPHLDGHNLWQLRQRLRAGGAGGQAAEEAGHVLYAERPHVHGERLHTPQRTGGWACVRAQTVRPRRGGADMVWLAGRGRGGGRLAFRTGGRQEGKKKKLCCGVVFLWGKTARSSTSQDTGTVLLTCHARRGLRHPRFSAKRNTAGK